MNIEERAVITPVYYNRGYFMTADDSAVRDTKRSAKAPFNILQIEVAEGGAIDTFIMPEQSLFGSAGDVPAQVTNHEREGIGYLGEDRLVVEPHELGAWDGAGDVGTWKDCFFMGHV